jgi:hypothetical protein
MKAPAAGRRSVAREANETTMEPRHHQLQELAAELERETALVEQLRDALVQQRAGVAASSAEAVEASVDAVGRILLTLEEARRRRAALVGALAGDGPPALDRIEAALRAPLPATLEQARARLRRAAREVTMETAINREVLRRALEAGEAFLQELFSSADAPAPVYHAPDAGEPKRTAAGVLLDRKA